MNLDLPEIGVGTWLNEGEECARAVAAALDLGYRHVDTARAYANEEAVGEGLARADVPREELIVATKVSTPAIFEEPPDVELPDDDPRRSVDLSLEALGVETIDLLYVHWPLGAYDAEETLPVLDELRDEGTIREIGVCNFTIELLDEARETLDAPLVAHQTEMHPLCQQEELLDYAQRFGHTLVAYSPLAHGRVFDVPELQSVADKHTTSEAQVSLAWLLSKDDVVVVPKATSRKHLRENLAARSLELDDEDIELIDSIDREERVIDFPGAPWR